MNFRNGMLVAMLTLTVGAAPRLRSPREKTEMPNVPMRRVAAAVVIEQVRLTWKYPLPMPQPNIVFDIEHSVNLKTGSWAKVGETNAPPFIYAVSGKMGFFRVITRSTATNSVTLAWDPPSDPSVVGYVIYRGPAHETYTNSTPIAGASTSTAIISNVVARTFFTATSRAGNGLESFPSNEVDYTPPPFTTSYPVSSLTITKL